MPTIETCRKCSKYTDCSSYTAQDFCGWCSSSQTDCTQQRLCAWCTNIRQYKDTGTGDFKRLLCNEGDGL
jgi:hypothetical protein